MVRICQDIPSLYFVHGTIWIEVTREEDLWIVYLKNKKCKSGQPILETILFFSRKSKSYLSIYLSIYLSFFLFIYLCVYVLVLFCFCWSKNWKSKYFKISWSTKWFIPFKRLWILFLHTVCFQLVTFLIEHFMFSSGVASFYMEITVSC